MVWYRIEPGEVALRGRFQDQTQLFSYISPERRVPANHPLRQIGQLVRDVLKDLIRSLGALYASEGPPLSPTRAATERIAASGVLRHPLGTPVDRAALFRWFVGLSPNEQVWDATTFSKNRDRLQSGDILQKFMSRLLNHLQVASLLSDEHFWVVGTLS